MIFPRSILHPSFVDLAALQKVQWIFPPASSLIKYYHLHSVKLGKTTEGINDSPRIKQQLSNRKHRSLKIGSHGSQVPFRQGDVLKPLSPWDFANQFPRPLCHCFPHLKIVLMQFQDAFLNEFQGAQALLIPPPAQRLTPHYRCLSVPLCVIALTPVTVFVWLTE